MFKVRHRLTHIPMALQSSVGRHLKANSGVAHPQDPLRSKIVPAES